MNVELSSAAAKALRRLDATTRARIIKGIAGLEKEPPEGDILPMSGHPSEFRLRVGGYRVIYKLEKNYIRVLAIGPRGDIYK